MPQSSGLQADHVELGFRHLPHQPLGEFEVLAHGKLHVLQHRQRGEQRALLEQDAPAALDGAPRLLVGAGQIAAQHLDVARISWARAR